MTRSTAFFVNGGAGRHICSIPALEKYEQENPDDDFIIVCEGGMDMYKGHPTLHSRAFDNWHKGLFEEKIKDRNCVSTEPYRVWEYYNQKASLAQAFDIQINNKGIRDLPNPTYNMATDEYFSGSDVVKEVKEKTQKSKVIVFQPYGRSAQPMGGAILDSGGRSFSSTDAVKIIKKLQKKYGVIVMSEFNGFDWKAAGCSDPVAQPENTPLRIWSSIIKNADGFIGCDSVGQHLSHTFNIPSIVVLGSTFQENVSYPDSDTFQVLDVGVGRRKYDPIRISFEEEISRQHDGIMTMSDEAISEIVKEFEIVMNKGSKNASKK
jgi:ADP-heptose:LPS heptosyltransferase